MKNLIISSILAAGALAGVTRVAAVPYGDTDVRSVWLSSGEKFTDTFNISSGDGGFGDFAGYNSATEQINSALATFTFLDVNQKKTSVKVDFGNKKFAQVSALILPPAINGGLSASALLDLSPDGILKYTVKNSGSSNFQFVSASLVAIVTPKSSVPDGGETLILLALSLVAMGFAYRLIQKAKVQAV